jgi:type I restriction enzyme S subunit
MSNAKSKRLGDLINFKRGYDLTENQRQPGVYPVISSSGISGYHNEYKVEGQGVVTGRYGTLGEMYYVDGRYWPHNTALYITNFRGNNPKYVYYLLKCLGRIRTSDKSAVPGVNRNELHEMAVPAIEDTTQQKRVAAVLTALDDKIECNNRISSELEAMAKTLYDYWFVQFEFPNTKGKPYKSSCGKMIYDPALRREIPESWKGASILTVAHVLGGGTPTKKKPEYWHGDIPFFTPTDADGALFKFSTTDYITEEGLRKSSTKLFEKNTILITARGSVGKLVVAGVDMAMNQSCYALKAKPGLSYSYLFFLAKELIHHLKVKSSGSVFNSIVSNDIELTNLVIPNGPIIEKFASKVEPMFERIASSTQESQQLAQLRDWLLPMLMNGQVSVG